MCKLAYCFCQGVCRDATGLVVFTDALPGEKLVAEVTKIKKGKHQPLHKQAAWRVLVPHPCCNTATPDALKAESAAGYAEASKVETLQPHANAAAAPCPHFGVCGGCNYQSLKYAAQLQAKQAQVLEAFQHVGGIDLSMCNVLPIVPCQNQYHYRNNMQFAFGTAAISGSTAQRQASSLSSNATSMQETPPEVVQPQEEKAAPEVQQSGKATIAPSQQSEANTQLSHTETRPMFLGLHAMNDPSQIVPIDTCLLQDSDASKLLHAAQDACAKVSQLVAHHFSTPQGFLRQLTIRRNSNSEYLILITSTSCRPHILQPLVKALLATAVNVRGIVNRVVPQPARSTPAKHLGKGKPKHRKVRKHGHATHRQTDQNSSSAATGAVGKPSSHILFGVGEIAEQLCGLEFGISADSFFQVNSRQAEVLYGMVQDAAGTKR